MAKVQNKHFWMAALLSRGNLKGFLSPLKTAVQKDAHLLPVTKTYIPFSCLETQGTISGSGIEQMAGESNIRIRLLHLLELHLSALQENTNVDT